MSEIRATTISDSAGTGPITLTGQSAAKAWVNFNGTGTVAISDSYAVSSITDNGVGIYAVNFTSAFSNASYCIAGNSGWGFTGTGSSVLLSVTNASTTYFEQRNLSGTLSDPAENFLAAHGDLA